MKWTSDPRGRGPHIRDDRIYTIGDCLISVSEARPLVPEWGTVVFLHGRLCGAEMWGSLISHFTRQVRCISLDYPGYGGSFSSQGRYLSLDEVASIICQVLDEVAPESSVLIGHDIGGAIAQICALQRRDRVSGLVLVNSTCVTRPLLPLSVRFRGLFVQRQIRKIGFMRPLSSQAIKALESMQRSFPSDEEANRWHEQLCKLRMPALVLCGSRDPVNALGNCYELARLLPDAVFFEHEAAGHMICEEATEWVAHKLGEFLGELGPVMPVYARK